MSKSKLIALFLFVTSCGLSRDPYDSNGVSRSVSALDTVVDDDLVFTDGQDHSIYIETVSTGGGNHLTVKAGDSAGGANELGGNVIIKPGKGNPRGGYVALYGGDPDDVGSIYGGLDIGNSQTSVIVLGGNHDSTGTPTYSGAYIDFRGGVQSDIGFDASKKVFGHAPASAGAYNITYEGGTGFAGSGGTAGSNGGITTVRGGIGGAGTASALPGSGGATVFEGGSAGANGGYGGNNGGSIAIRGGAPSGSGSAGSVTIGADQTTGINFGNSSCTTTFTGTTSTATYSGNVSVVGQSGTGPGALDINSGYGTRLKWASSTLTIDSAVATVNVPFKLASYTTAGRPSASSAGAGAVIRDTTVGLPLFSDGTNWKDFAGNTH